MVEDAVKKICQEGDVARMENILGIPADEIQGRGIGRFEEYTSNSENLVNSKGLKEEYHLMDGDKFDKEIKASVGNNDKETNTRTHYRIMKSDQPDYDDVSERKDLDHLKQYNLGSPTELYSEANPLETPESAVVKLCNFDYKGYYSSLKVNTYQNVLIGSKH